MKSDIVEKGGGKRRSTDKTCYSEWGNQPEATAEWPRSLTELETRAPLNVRGENASFESGLTVTEEIVKGPTRENNNVGREERDPSLKKEGGT